MPGPKNQELGTRSPYRQRMGIDIPTFRGVNKEADPGAIDNSQWQHAYNARIAAGGIVSRGGQEAALDSAVDGCIYGMIDVNGQAGFVFTNTKTLIWSDVAGVEPLDFDYDFTPDLTIAQGLVKFQDRNFVATSSGLAQFSFSNNVENSLLQMVVQEPFFIGSSYNSYCIRNEGGTEVMYIGTTAGAIWRYDGNVLTREATGIGSGPLVMIYGLGEVYAASNGSFVARGTGSWTTSYAVGDPTFTPIAGGGEYKNTILVPGNIESGGDEYAYVYSFNGSALSSIYDATTNPLGSGVETAFGFFVGCGKGMMSSGYTEAPANPRRSVLQGWNGSAWAVLDSITLDDNNPNPGIIIASSPDRVYWWARRDETSGSWLPGQCLRRNTDFQATPTSGWTTVYADEGGGGGSDPANLYAIIYP